jgi:hypothetical protein
MTIPPLSPNLTREILLHLGVEPESHSLTHIDSLIDAYTRTVPWESAFRIAKKARAANVNECPRWPEEFWRDSIDNGGGGTCFESNYAFFSLLRALGYAGYLTINNMGDSIGCHTAIVLTIDGERWLVDVGIPNYVALPIRTDSATERSSPYLHYKVIPDGEGRFQIERYPHPKTNIFTLIDTPVSDAAYRAATTNDYGAKGLFLDRIIVNKVIDGTPRRFNSTELPPHFEVFENGQRTDYEITVDVPTAVARHFSMDETTVRAAFDALSLQT